MCIAQDEEIYFLQDIYFLTFFQGASSLRRSEEVWGRIACGHGEGIMQPAPKSYTYFLIYCFAEWLEWSIAMQDTRVLISAGTCISFDT